MLMLSIRNDLTSEQLRRLARRERDPRVGRRMLAIASALEGVSRAMAARGSPAWTGRRSETG
jgi:hypothetical protein